MPTPRGESKSYALRVLVHLDADASTGAREQWAEWAAANGDGWPHHLRGQMEAVAEEMLRADMPRLQGLDAKRIVDGVTERRNTYYEDRIGGTNLPRFQDVFAALSASAERLGGADVDTLGDEAEKLLHGRRNAPDPDALVQAAIHAGVLQYVTPTRVACPIPSMRRWLETGRYEPLEAPQADGLTITKA